MKKYLTILIILCLAAGNLSAQKIKYKELMPMLLAASEEDAFSYLNAFIVSDLDHPNANLRLALIYRDRYKRADLLTEYDKAIANAERAKSRFLKAKLLVDEKEIRRNDDYYISISASSDAKGKQSPNTSEILQMIEAGYSSADALLNAAPPIYKNFTSSVYHYDKAIKIFSAINGKYASLDELYLLYNAKLGEDLASLKTAFDSSVYYFNEYKKLIEAYPISGHNQEYVLQSIQTYRLDGLITQMDFLNNKLVFWNYAEWVNEINATIDQEIVKLRDNIEKNEQAVADGLKLAANTPIDEFLPIKLDKETVFKLKKYDYQSLVVALLEYKQYKQGLVNKLQNRTYYDTATTLEPQRKYAYYSEIIHNARAVDSLILRLKQRNLPSKVEKHQDFIQQYYKGSQGVSNFISEEDGANKRIFSSFVDNLRGAILDDLSKQAPTETRSAKHKTFNLPYFISTKEADSVKQGEMMTTHRSLSPDGSTYLTGVYRPDKKLANVVSYVARIGADGKLIWLKDYNIAVDSLGTMGNTSTGALELTKEGCALLLTTRNPSDGTRINSFVYLSEKGEEKFIKRLEVGDFPRKINYKESNSSFVLIFKGSSHVQDITNGENLQLISINAIGDVLWKRSWEMAGTFEELVNLQDGYLLVGNYTAIKDQQGRMVRTKVNEGQTNAWLIRLDLRGDQKSQSLINNQKSFFISKVVKVNDSNINLLGYEGKYAEHYSKVLNIQDQGLTHIIVDSGLRELSSSL